MMAGDKIYPIPIPINKLWLARLMTANFSL